MNDELDLAEYARDLSARVTEKAVEFSDEGSDVSATAWKYWRTRGYRANSPSVPIGNPKNGSGAGTWVCWKAATARGCMRSRR